MKKSRFPKFSIMIVDNDETIIEILTQMLRLEGITNVIGGAGCEREKLAALLRSPLRDRRDSPTDFWQGVPAVFLYTRTCYKVKDAYFIS